MFNKIETIAAGISIATLVLAFVLINDELSALPTANIETQAGAAALSVEDEQEMTINENNLMNELKITDTREGEGQVVAEGDTVVVHYRGTFQNGQEFDSSHKRGTPLEFTVGEGRVIAGWEQGLLGMKVGGERNLVIPPELGYGARGIGPIPGNSTLLFEIELLEIK